MFRRYIFVFILYIFLSGCSAKIQYTAEFPSKTVFKTENVFWFWGLVGKQSYEVSEICNEGRIYEINVHRTLTQSSLTFLTLGIYSPLTTQIVCSIRGD